GFSPGISLAPITQSPDHSIAGGSWYILLPRSLAFAEIILTSKLRISAWFRLAGLRSPALGWKIRCATSKLPSLRGRRSDLTANRYKYQGTSLLVPSSDPLILGFSPCAGSTALQVEAPNFSPAKQP